MQKTILYIAMSEDGFIAGDNDDLGFLNPYHVEGEDYGYGSFLQTVGSIVVGRRTHDKVISMGYPYHEDREVHVITRTTKPSVGKLHFDGGDLPALIDRLKRSNDGHVYCDGGAGLAHSLMQQRLIDEIILSVIPTQLHRGTLLFAGGQVPVDFEHRGQKAFPTGLVQHHYALKTPQT